LDRNALDAPYLFHSSSDPSTDDALTRKLNRRDAPSKLAFGCGRRGDALKLYLVWLSKGSAYLADQVELAINHAQTIYKEICEDDTLSRLLEVSTRHGSQDNLYAQICFRPLLSGSATRSIEEKSKATRHVHNVLRQRQQYAVDFAPVGGDQGDFIR
jgi:glutamate decarboxylase